MCGISPCLMRVVVWFVACRAEGTQQKETGSINTSLSHLGHVIKQITDGSKHISYRNSKLTMLLQGQTRPVNPSLKCCLVVS